MLTGDHTLTAGAVARELGIARPGDLAVTGADLDFLPQQALEEEVERFSVYARVSPEHKIRIVNAWQRRGNIVSMTGDGVNDAPALKKADIGVAMGITGTEVSKDAASMILADDNFATIVKAVVNGRAVYANIKNAISFLLSGNMAGNPPVLFSLPAQPPLPLPPVTPPLNHPASPPPPPPPPPGGPAGRVRGGAVARRRVGAAAVLSGGRGADRGGDVGDHRRAGDGPLPHRAARGAGRHRGRNADGCGGKLRRGQHRRLLRDDCRETDEESLKTRRV